MIDLRYVCSIVIGAQNSLNVYNIMVVVAHCRHRHRRRFVLIVVSHDLYKPWQLYIYSRLCVCVCFKPFKNYATTEMVFSLHRRTSSCQFDTGFSSGVCVCVHSFYNFVTVANLQNNVYIYVYCIPI